MTHRRCPPKLPLLSPNWANYRRDGAPIMLALQRLFARHDALSRGFRFAAKKLENAKTTSCNLLAGQFYTPTTSVQVLISSFYPPPRRNLPHTLIFSPFPFLFWFSKILHSGLGWS